MNNEADLRTYPPSDSTHPAVFAAKIVAAVMPFASNTTSLILSTFFPEVGRVQIAWFERLGASILDLRQQVSAHELRLDTVDERLQELQKALDEYLQRPQFLAAVLRTTDQAVRDPLQKKWEAYSNIVLQNTVPHPLDDTLQIMFLSNLASFGEWHLYLLKFFDKPRGWQMSAGGGEVGLSHRTVEPLDTIAYHIPELAAREELTQQCIAKLTAEGLMSLDADKLIAEDPNFSELPLSFFDRLGRGPKPQIFRLTTSLGQQFLQFIARPDIEALQRKPDV